MGDDSIVSARIGKLSIRLLPNHKWVVRLYHIYGWFKWPIFYLRIRKEASIK